MQLIWEDFLKIIKEEAGSQIVETWFKAVRFEKWDREHNTVVLIAPNLFVRKWIQEHYTQLIKTHLSRLLHVDSIKLFLASQNNESAQKLSRLMPASPLQRGVNFEVAKFTPYSPLPKIGTPYFKTPTKSGALKIIKNAYIQPIKKSYLHSPKLNEQYVFDSFVVGPSNSLAHAAACAVSHNLGKVYNPLFIYGGTGLGKTHLLHAIGNEVKKNNPSSIIYYETSDNFMNQFINAIKLDKVRQFRERYQKVHLLLLDDIQFFSNKEQTQEMFFHIFDSLHSQQKQVVFSSDTLPRDISGLQNRLKSRLQSGLVADVHMPTLEMKTAILKKKAAIQNINIDDDVAKLVASKPVSSIRELEGHLIRLAAYSSLTKQPINIELVEKVLSEQYSKKKNIVSLDATLKVVAKYYSVAVGDLKSKQRNKEIALARQIAFYMMKKVTSSSLQTIGEYVGGRDHSTVLHAIAKIEALIKTDLFFSKKIKAIENTLMP